MRKLDIIIPTMWRDSALCDRLEKYAQCNVIRKIIIIDNSHKTRPNSDIFDNAKIELVSYGKNIYVNPAWNEGYYRSKTDVICILNDDIDVDVSVFEYISELDFTDIDIVGVHLKGSIDNYHIVDHPDKMEELIRLNVNKNHPIGGQSYAFGVCMFIKRSSYKVIPSLYQIWLGDDYLVQKNENIYTLKTSKIKGEISKTIVEETRSKNSDIQRRIDLDCINGYRYNHFLNGKNWDLLRNAYQKFNNEQWKFKTYGTKNLGMLVLDKDSK